MKKYSKIVIFLIYISISIFSFSSNNENDKLYNELKNKITETGSSWVLTYPNQGYKFSPENNFDEDGIYRIGVWINESKEKDPIKGIISENMTMKGLIYKNGNIVKILYVYQVSIFNGFGITDLEINNRIDEIEIEIKDNKIPLTIKLAQYIINLQPKGDKIKIKNNDNSVIDSTVIIDLDGFNAKANQSYNDLKFLDDYIATIIKRGEVIENDEKNILDILSKNVNNFTPITLFLLQNGFYIPQLLHTKDFQNAIKNTDEYKETYGRLDEIYFGEYGWFIQKQLAITQRNEKAKSKRSDDVNVAKRIEELRNNIKIFHKNNTSKLKQAYFSKEIKSPMLITYYKLSKDGINMVDAIDDKSFGSDEKGRMLIINSNLPLITLYADYRERYGGRDIQGTKCYVNKKVEMLDCKVYSPIVYNKKDMLYTTNNPFNRIKNTLNKIKIDNLNTKEYAYPVIIDIVKIVQDLKNIAKDNTQLLNSTGIYELPSPIKIDINKKENLEIIKKIQIQSAKKLYGIAEKEMNKQNKESLNIALGEVDRETEQDGIYNYIQIYDVDKQKEYEKNLKNGNPEYRKYGNQIIQREHTTYTNPITQEGGTNE